MVEPRNASVAVVGAGDYIGAAIARRLAREGYLVHAGRRNGEKLAPLVAQIEAAGGRCVGKTLDARDEAAVAAFINEAEAAAPVEVTVFNIGANVNFPIRDTTARVYRKVWEMACFAGFLTGREAARKMIPRGRGTILFTGASASLRGRSGYAAFSGAKHALRSLAQSMAKELGPQGVHVAHVVIDGAIDTAFIRENRPDLYEQRKGTDGLLAPDAIAETFWQIHRQPRTAWTFETDLRPWAEPR